MSDLNASKVPVQFTDGCAVSDEIAYISSIPDEVDDDIDFARLFALNSATTERWFHHDWNGGRVTSVCLRSATETIPRAVCALTEGGAVEIANSGNQFYERIAGAGLAPGSRSLGNLRRIREINGRLYACGAGNQVYERTDLNWNPIDQDLVVGTGMGREHLVRMLKNPSGQLTEDQLLAVTSAISSAGSLDDIDGTDDNDVYVCGLDGSLWHWNGRSWQKQRFQGDDHLHGIHVVSRAEVWVCGHNGTLLTGNSEQGFRSLIGTEKSDHFWSIRKFRDKIYLGTARGLYEWNGQALRDVRLPDAIAFPAIQALDTSSNALWVFADRFVARLLNGKWERFNHPDNDD